MLLHGNIVSADDWVLSGVLDRVAQRHRVIALTDRAGYSDRPQGSAWGAAAQADLLLRAFEALRIEHPVVVGHSWGTNAALALALADPTALRGARAAVGLLQPDGARRYPAGRPAAAPVVGDVLRYTVSPLFGAATLPLLVKGMFAPPPVPERFRRASRTGWR